MKIGINLFGEQKLKSGTGRYSYELLKQLSKQSSHVFYVFATKGISDSFKVISENVRIIELNVPQNVVLRRLLEQIVIPLQARKYQLDFIHSTNNLGLIINNVKQSITVHDLARFRVPYNSGKVMNFFMKLLQKITLKKAKFIITVSEGSKKDIVRYINVSPDRIHVVKNGIDTNKFRKLPESVVQHNLKKLNINEKYIVSYSSLERRKNFIGAVEALKKANVPLKLILIGKKSYKSGEIFEKIDELKMQNQVQYLGFVSDEELVSVLNGAEFFLFPTFFEGAGMTPLEAMACGLPVITSDIEPIREYCGDAFLPVDPNNIDSIADAIKLLYTDSNLRQSLIEKSRQVYSKNSWEQHAKSLLSLWENKK